MPAQDTGTMSLLIHFSGMSQAINTTANIFTAQQFCYIYLYLLTSPDCNATIAGLFYTSQIEEMTLHFVNPDKLTLCNQAAARTDDFQKAALETEFHMHRRELTDYTVSEFKLCSITKTVHIRGINKRASSYFTSFSFTLTGWRQMPRFKGYILHQRAESHVVIMRVHRSGYSYLRR